jgi:hypothetical protein
MVYVYIGALSDVGISIIKIGMQNKTERSQKHVMRLRIQLGIPM